MEDGFLAAAARIDHEFVADELADDGRLFADGLEGHSQALMACVINGFVQGPGSHCSFWGGLQEIENPGFGSCWWCRRAGLLDGS